MSLNVEMIRSSFDQAKPIADQVATKFYEFLWGDYPGSEALFEGVDMDDQKQSLMGGLTYIVDNVDNLDRLVPYLKKMGGRHTKYGAEDEHYAWVGGSLIKTFAFFFEDAWTTELEEEWVKAYAVVAETMIAGAAEERGDSAGKPADVAVQEDAVSIIRSRAKELSLKVLGEALEKGIDKDFEAAARAKVKELLSKILEEESEDIFKEIK